ncbi:hypothetical protein PPTG_24053 [Phytophthora nicotianae INRA-310]|uniref:Uncharacterized protein n=1 Tax=Phytophthora nicotianae (strain INRA-310) TaxID=761204 RepID=W2PN90_PHYN3|nr:hypothetical protein PPTG_24053 [Phytophthora nicotianae INRA-310]ETN01500.1 hypothetical protein PPTG_24053 [Phytophthora nicotianae INRA-310]
MTPDVTICDSKCIVSLIERTALAENKCGAANFKNTFSVVNTKSAGGNTGATESSSSAEDKYLTQGTGRVRLQQ